MFGPSRPGDILHSLADISVAERQLGYTPNVPFEEGIERTVAWFRDQATGR
jgi:nucleoside-diphosphate-sugar epimerase